MKIDAREWVATLRSLVKVASRPSALPEPGMLGIVINGDAATLTAVCAETSVKATAPVDGGGHASICIDAQSLLTVLSTAPSSTCDIAIDSTTLTVKSGRSKHSIGITDTFPPAIDRAGEWTVRIDKRCLSNATKVAYATSNDTTRPSLTCVHLQIARDGKVVALAVDGHRAAVFGKCIDDAAIEGSVSPTSISLLDGIESDVVDVSDVGNFIVFSSPTMTVHARKLDTDATPFWRWVTPTEQATIAYIDVSVLKGSVRRVASLCQKTTGIQVTPNGSSLHLSAATDSGASEDIVTVESMSGDMPPFKVNIMYLMQCLDVHSDVIEIHVVDGETKITIVDGKFTSTIMPMR